MAPSLFRRVRVSRPVGALSLGFELSLPTILHSAFPSSVAALRRVDCLLPSPRGGFGGALGEPWGSLGGALVEPWGSLGVALGWLCTPESMPSIWPCGGLVVALGGLPDHSAFCI